MPSLKSYSYPIGSVSQGIYYAFTSVLLPLYLITFTKNTTLIGFAVAFASFEAAITSFVLGPLTDRIHIPIWRRKIFILSGTLLVFVTLLAIPHITALSILILVILLAHFGHGLVVAPYFALLSSNAETSQRGQIAALCAVGSLIGQVCLTLIASKFWSPTIPSDAFMIIAAIFFVPYAITVLFSKDKVIDHARFHTYAVKDYISFFRDRSRRYYLLSQLLLWFGINSVIPFFILFMKDYLGLSQQQSIIFYLVIVLASGIFAYPFALLAKRIGNRKAFTIGLVAFMLAACLGIFAKGLPMSTLYLLSFFAGFGNAATVVFTYSLLTHLTPEHEMGMASGVHTFIVSAFAPLAAILSGYLIRETSYIAMFVLLVATTALSLLFLSHQSLARLNTQTLYEN